MTRVINDRNPVLLVGSVGKDDIIARVLVSIRNLIDGTCPPHEIGVAGQRTSSVMNDADTLKFFGSSTGLDHNFLPLFCVRILQPLYPC